MFVCLKLMFCCALYRSSSTETRSVDWIYEMGRQRCIAPALLRDIKASEHAKLRELGHVFWFSRVLARNLLIRIDLIRKRVVETQSDCVSSVALSQIQ
jgi:hypothetical protein